MKTFILLDEETEKINQELQAQNLNFQLQLIDLNARREEIISNISTLEKQAEEASNQLFNSSQKIAEAKFEQSAQLMAKEFQKQKEDLQNEYVQILQDMAEETSNQIEVYQKELGNLKELVENQRSLATAAVEANKRAQEMIDKKDFYRLNLSDVDLQEIEKLRSILPYLRNSEPLNKVIWKVYYEKPYTDLVGRVVGTKVKTGIYKITNLENNMCYVGQAVNIADRWKQHIKRGVGAEAPTRNKLYPAMLAIGVENFTFEIVEECEKSKLNEREDYWQEYFHAKDFGYSIK